MRFALAQLNFTVGAFEANFLKSRRHARPRGGADLLVLSSWPRRATRRATC
jgi:hypothetical protein